METLRRTICTDNVKSHLNGIVPFCPYNQMQDITYVDAGIYNGNYGGYPCDFVFIDASGITVDGVFSINEKEYSRKVYLETLRKYYFITKTLEDATLVKKVVDNRIYVNYSGTTESGGTESGETLDCDATYTFYNDGQTFWKESSDEYEIYSVTPFNVNAFIYDFDTKCYIFDEEEYPDFKEIVENSDKLLLISNYDSYLQIEAEWNNWWQDGFEHAGNSGDTWEETYLNSGYTAPKQFKFCQDFEKYFLGLIHVPQVFEGNPIEGGKVPEVVYYLDFKDYLDWFKDNEQKVGNDITLKREWDSRGGDNFYAFLKTIEPIWITRYTPTLESVECETYFSFAAPYLGMSLFFGGNFRPEKMYSPYEYDLSETEYGLIKTDATKPYVAPVSGVGSALTPHFVSFSDWQEVAYGDSDYLYGDNTPWGLYDGMTDDTKKEEVDENGYIHLFYLDVDSAGTSAWTEFGVILNEEMCEKFDNTFDYLRMIDVDSAANITHFFVTTSDYYGQIESALSTLYSEDAIYLADDIFGIFDTFKNASGESIGQLFKCTYHSASSATPDISVCYSGYSYEYRILDHYDDQGNHILEYVPQKIVTRETEFIHEAETAPMVTSDCYQVVGLEVIQSGIGHVDVDSAASITYNSFGMKQSEFLYSTAYTTNVYGWWECEKIDFDLETMRCADGEAVDANDETKYRNIMLLSNLVNFVPSVGERNEGDAYYFMAVYDNGYVSSDDEDGFKWISGETQVTMCEITNSTAIKKFKLPYVLNEPKNMMTHPSEDGDIMTYDTVTAMNYNENTLNLEIEYVLGATSGADIAETGIHCFEEYSYSVEKEKLPVDGVHLADVFYEKLDYTGREVGDEELGVTRTTRLARILGMEVGTQWTKDSAVNAYLLVRDGVGELMDEMQYDIDATFDRGNASAWEKHFKLSECNTMEDLTNYSNNIFNI